MALAPFGNKGMGEISMKTDTVALLAFYPVLCAFFNKIGDRYCFEANILKDILIVHVKTLYMHVENRISHVEIKIVHVET